MRPRWKANKRLRALIRNQVLWTRVAKSLGRKVAWVTSGAPVEILLANGIVPFYPENHAAICAARGMGAELAQRAEVLGYSPDLCSYFRVDFGSQTSGLTPLGKLIPPDLVLVCNNICGTVQNWFRITAENFRVPFLFLDTPFADGTPRDHDIEYVKAQLLDLCRASARIASCTFREKRLLAVARRSMEALSLWSQILKTPSERPAPFTSFDAFVHMAPIVSMRGTRRAVRYYRLLLEEIRSRRGIPAVPREEIRLVWDNIAIWPIHRALKGIFGENGVALVADSYTSAWGVRNIVDEKDPLLALAGAYTDILLNHGATYRTALLTKMVTEYSADGAIFHSNRSCKRFSLGQYRVAREVQRATGKPSLVIEADMADPRLVDLTHLKQRLLAFFEMLKGR